MTQVTSKTSWGLPKVHLRTYNRSLGGLVVKWECAERAKSSISFGYTKRDCWFCTHIYLQSLYFILCTAKEIVDSAHILTCRAMKWNVWNCTLSFTTLLQELMISHKSVWRVQNHQSLLVLGFHIGSPKEIVDSAHTFTCRAIKWNVWNSISSFTTLLQEVLILHKSVSTVQNHQSFFGTFILYCVQQKRLLILRTL